MIKVFAISLSLAGSGRNIVRINPFIERNRQNKEKHNTLAYQQWNEWENFNN